VTADEVMRILAKSPAKQSELDPARTCLVQRAGIVPASVIAAICNASFQQVALLPRSCKKAVVRPLLNKRSLDPDDPATYRPISNLGFLSIKVIEKVVDAELSAHISSNRLLRLFQSAYRPSVGLSLYRDSRHPHSQ